MKIAKVILPLIFLAVLPVLLLATQTANLSVLFNIDTDIPYQQAVMDTDSTLCLYNYAGSFPPQQSLSVRRIHHDGFIEPQETIYSFTGNIVTNDSFHRLISSQIVGHSIHFVFANRDEFTYLIVSGTDVTSYTIPNVPEIMVCYGPVHFNNRLFFIHQNHNADYQQQLWVLDYLAGEVSMVYSFHPEAGEVRVTRLGENRLLISYVGGEQYPVMLMDTELNLSPTNLYNQIITPNYSFDENHFYALWNDPFSGYRDLEGIMTVDSNNISLDTWAYSDIMETWSEVYHFYFALPGNLHPCVHVWGMMSGGSRRNEMYSYDGQGNVDLYTGFPQIDTDPNPPYSMILYQDKLLLIYLTDGQYDFRLADCESQEWIPVSGSPLAWPAHQSQYINFIHNNKYIYVISGGTLTCLKLDISVSTDDPVAAPPALKAYPNPFQSSVKLEFDSIATNPAVEIYNLRGQKVRTLPSQPDGIIWDGKDTSGNRLSSGIYFARPQGGKQKTLKLLKLGD